MNFTFALPLIRQDKVATDTYALWFDRKKTLVDFLPGQFVSLMLETTREEWRDFTIASSPHEKDVLVVTKLRESPFKQMLLSKKPGEEIVFKGPSGGFQMREHEVNPYIFLSGGIGITPFRSMMLYADHEKLGMPITLFASFATLTDVLFYDELMRVAKANLHMNVIYTLTKHDKTHKWLGEEGRISPFMIKKYIHDLSEAVFYIAGSPIMVEDTQDLLHRMGVLEKQIRVEHFSGY